MRLLSRASILLALLFAAPGCGGGGGTGDIDASRADAATDGLDGGPAGDTGPASDAGPRSDGGAPADGGPGADVGPGVDAGPLPDAGECQPGPSDLAPLGSSCEAAACPAGFSCQEYSGIVLSHSCAIRCELTGCPCPSGTRCEEVRDKVSTWHECHWLPD